MAGLILVIAAVLVRAISAASRARRESWWRFPGHYLARVTAWPVANAWGGWVPLWPLLILSLVGVLIDGGKRLDEESVVGWRSIAIDLIILSFYSRYALPQWRYYSVMLFCLLFLLTTRVVDFGVVRLSERSSFTLLLAGGVLLAWALLKSQERFWYRSPDKPLYAMLPYLGFHNGERGERVVLDNGSVAWLSCKSGNPSGGALLFHGHDHRGAEQRAAVSIARALEAAGYEVLALDHPGFGSSPPPSRGQLTNWDPAPSSLLAYDFLSQRHGANVIVVGHSMGASDALRVISARAPLRAFLVGASHTEFTREQQLFRHSRFSQVRELESPLSFDEVVEIHKNYYDFAHLAAKLPREHCEIHLVDFSLEHADVTRNRQQLEKYLPGPTHRKMLDDSTHYLSTNYIGPLTWGDTRVVERLGVMFRN